MLGHGLTKLRPQKAQIQTLGLVSLYLARVVRHCMPSQMRFLSNSFDAFHNNLVTIDCELT